MTQNLVMTLNLNTASEYDFCNFYSELFIYSDRYKKYEYNEELNEYYVYKSSKYQKKIDYNVQIGKYFRTINNGCLHLKIVEYNIEYDFELLDFIDINFPAISKYLKTTNDYNIQIGFSRLFNDMSYEKSNYINDGVILGSNEDIKKILAIIYLVRRINFGSQLDKYNKVLVLSPLILNNIMDIIYNNQLTIYHIKYLINKEDIYFTLPLNIEDETIIDCYSLNVISELPETKFCFMFCKLIYRKLCTKTINNLINISQEEIFYESSC